MQSSRRVVVMVLMVTWSSLYRDVELLRDVARNVWKIIKCCSILGYLASHLVPPTAFSSVWTRRHTFLDSISTEGASCFFRERFCWDRSGAIWCNSPSLYARRDWCLWGVYVCLACFFRQDSTILPKTNSKFAPENRWLENSSFFLWIGQWFMGANLLG